MLFNTEGFTNNFFTLSPKVRRQTGVIQGLTNMIGKNIKLYDMVLQFLRTLFLRTRNVHYCTLRAELLMALHDLEIHDIWWVEIAHHKISCNYGILVIQSTFNHTSCISVRLIPATNSLGALMRAYESDLLMQNELGNYKDSLIRFVICIKNIIITYHQVCMFLHSHNIKLL